MHVTELAAAAGLLLIAALLADGGADLFTVSHSGSGQLGIHAEAALELGAQHVDLNIAGTGDHGLVGLGVVHHVEGGILLVELVEAGTQLLHLLLGLGGDGTAVAGLGIVHAVETHDALGVAQGVAGLDLIHLADGADVAAADLLDLLALLALHDVQAAQLLGVAGGGVIQGHIAGDPATEHLHHGVLAVLIGDGLKDDGGGGAVGIAGHLDIVAVVILRRLSRHIRGHGDQIQNGLHQHLHAQTGDGGAAQHRADAAVPDAQLQATGHVLGGQLHGVEELLHQLLVGAGGGLHQLSPQGLYLVGHIGGNGAGSGLAALDLVSGVMQQIHDARDLLVAVNDRGHNGNHGLAELALQSIQAGLIVAVVLVGAVDEDHAGLLAQQLPAALHTHGQAVLGGTHQHGALGGTNGGNSLTGEIKVAGSVHDVDTDVLIFDRGKGQRNRDLALDLLGIVVADGVAVGGTAQTIRSLGHEEHLLGQSRLAGATVTQQADVANVIGSHIQYSPFVWYECAVRRSQSIRRVYTIFLHLTNTTFSVFFVENAGRIKDSPGMGMEWYQ